MRIALIGGHLSPALAVMEQLSAQEIVFIGRKYAREGDTTESYEYKTITEKGIPFISLSTGRLQRSLSRHTLSSLGKIPGGFSASYAILKKEKPDVVLSFGGYLSVPLCFAAKMLRIPVVIHEQTMRAGLANKLTSRVATKICISWESSASYFPKKKSVLTGNPIRKEVISIKNQKRQNHDRPVLYITGGSTGSHAINKAVKEILSDILQTYTVYHQTGQAVGYIAYDEIMAAKQALPEELAKYYHVASHYSSGESAKLLHDADLVISRSGVNTVTELLYLEKPALLIPLPYGQKDEQATNADYLRESGLATVITQPALTPSILLSQIREMFAKINTYTVRSHMHDNERNMHASQKLAEVVSHVSSYSVPQEKSHTTS